MKITNILKGVVVGAVMLTVAGTSFAENISIYGASAQYLYWSIAGKSFLTSKGCVAPTGKTAFQCAKTSDNKNAIIWAKCGGVDTYFRVSAKASYDGICALEDNYAGTNPNCTTFSPANSRNMASSSATTWLDCNDAGTSWGVTGTQPVPINVGASDVAGESFLQASHGLLLGPLGGAQTDRVFTGMKTVAGTNVPYTLQKCPRTLVVPFAFYANNTVKKNGATITNMPRMMATLIFSGQVFNWTDFGADFAAGVPVVACMRHAGSGTHATIDLAVMHGSWGANLATSSCNNGNPGDPMCTGAGLTPPTIFFNDGSGDELKCVNGNGAWSGNGAIGYADADQELVVGPGKTYANTVRLTYNGEQATALNIINGVYDNFWSNQQIYFRTATPWITNLCNFVDDYTTIPASELNYWAAQCEMNYEKTTDADYPAFVGASCGPRP